MPLNPHLFEVAVNLANSTAICIVSALAAGLSAFALMAGCSRLKVKQSGFPADAEARKSKYTLAYSQLLEARKDSPNGIKTLLEGLRGQPAARLGLSAFQEFLDSAEGQAALSGAGEDENQANKHGSDKTQVIKSDGNDGKGPAALKKLPKIAPPNQKPGK